MLGRTHCAGAHGLEGYVITVEADVGPGEPRLTIIGQTEGPLVVAAARVRAALEHCGILLPARAQLIHITPAERRKHGRGLDLAIACALLIAHDVLPPSALDGMLAWGDLAPDGRVLAVPGTLLAAATARRHNFRVLALAVTSEAEATPVPDLDLLLVSDLASLVAHLRGEASLPRGPARASLLDEPQTAIADEPAKQSSLSSLAIELMLAGGHHLLALARGLLVNERELAARLGPLTLADAIELTTIHDLLTPTRLLRAPSVRKPSVHASSAELFGSAHPIRPGEVSLAHHGVLVLDDLHQLAHQSTLAQVLADRSITHDGACFPARFRLLATSPRAKDLARRCSIASTSSCVTEPPPDPTAAQRIEVARARQQSRLAETPWRCNAEIPRFGDAIHSLCRTAQRPEPRVARVAQTLADLDLDRDPAEPLDADLLALAERLTLEAMTRQAESMVIKKRGIPGSNAKGSSTAASIRTAMCTFFPIAAAIDPR